MYIDEGASTSQVEGSGGTVERKAKPTETKVYVHALADLEKCEICHRPHFSAEAALITEPIQPLCGKCHDYKKASFGKAHIDIDGNLMDCRNCHSPHTSKSPKFFKDEIHKPFAERSCKDCHVVEKP
jgi:predicted CXXCH cytochrome family protein